jgi:hypothetical protein
LLYQMLTGERPFEGGMSAIMHKALNTEPPAPSQLSVTAPPSFDAVVRRAMAKRPEDRFPSASAFAEAMRVALANQAEPAVSEDEATMVAASPPPRTIVAATPPPAVPFAAPARRLNPLTIAVATVVVLGVVGGGAWWFRPRPPAPPSPVIGTTVAPPSKVADITPARPPVVAAPPSNAPAPNQGGANQSTTSPTAAPTPARPTADTLQPQPQPPAPPPVVPVPVPPPPAPPVTQPNSQQLTMAGLDALRRQIAQWVSSRSCAVLDGNLGADGLVTLNGLAGHGSVEDLQQGLTSFVAPGQIDMHVTGVNRVFCPALTALHPITPGFGVSGGTRLSLQMADGKTRLHDGEPVRVRLAMPDFAARLRVDYVAHDGSVQHLYPQLADTKNAITADPPRIFAPGEAVSLGHPSWLISEPYGTDMIIAVASSEPLFDRPRPANAETADVYLRDLQTAIDSLRQRGARLAGAAVTVDALP